MFRDIMILILFLIFSSCSGGDGNSSSDTNQQVNVDSTTRINDDFAIEETISEYGIDTLFEIVNEVKIRNEDGDYLMQRVKDKYNLEAMKKSSLVEVSNVKNFPVSNEKIEYYPIGQIALNDSLRILFIEEFERKHPYLFTKARALLFLPKENKIIEVLDVYSDNNIVIFDFDEVGFEWNNNSGVILKKDKLDSSNEDGGKKHYLSNQKTYQATMQGFQLVDEKIIKDSIK